MRTAADFTWYDILGVARDADAADRSRRPGARPPTSSSPARAPASSGCSTRPPTCCSTPQRRAEYDAGLAAARVEEPAPGAGERGRGRTPPRPSRGRSGTGGSSPRPPASTAAARGPGRTPGRSRRRASEDRRAPGGDAPVEPESRTPADRRARRGLLVPVWRALVAVAVVAVVGAGARRQKSADAGIGLKAGLLDGSALARRRRRPDAAAAAERALTAVLCYDYRHMDADRDRALKFLTPEVPQGLPARPSTTCSTRVPTASPGNAGKTKTVVTATCSAPGW